MVMIFIFISQILLAFATCPYDKWDSGFGQTGCYLPKCMVDSKVCASECPTLFNYYQLYCIVQCNNYCSKPSGDSAILFTLILSTVQDLTLTYVSDSSNSSKQFQNPGGISYNSPTQNSPLPTLDRGFYFAITSSMTGNQSYIPALYFTLNLWIKPLASGEILNVQISSTTYMRIWADGSGVYKFSALINNSSGSQISVVGASSAYPSSWHTASMLLNQQSCNTGYIIFYISSNPAGTTTLSSSEISFPSGTYTWTFGNISGGNSFRGFIYWLQARADNTATYGTSTPSVNCIENQYWDGSVCQNCASGCPAWPWCVRGSDCSYCYTADCSNCNGYSLSMCTACTTGIPPGCCDYIGTTCTQTWANTACSTGIPNNAGICLYGYPYGWYNCGGNSCFSTLTTNFAGSFAGIYTSVFITGTSSSSYNYWNSPEVSDPLPAKNRGLYFNLNQYLTVTQNLSNTWSIGMWVFAISGTIISHSTNKLTISSSGTINYDLEKWDGTSASYSTSQTTILNIWNYISYSVGFANKATTLAPYLNTVSGTAVTVTNYVFRLPNGGNLYLGKGSPNFNGFISYFQLWGTTTTDFSVPYNLYGFSGGVISTLWPCDYSYYYDGSTCQSCIGSCTMGCTRGTSCYICDDFLCSQCSSFAAGDCTLCVSNASGTPCVCNSGFYQPPNQALCSACPTECASCTGSAYYLCTSCVTSYFLYGSTQCLVNCPTGYTENSGTNNCDFLTTTGLSITFYDKLMLGSIGGVQVGSSNTNAYPIYDSNDPYPSYLRGYYFSGVNYLSTNTVIGPYFTVLIWIYPSGAGTIISKNVSSNEIFCLEILSSGYPKISLILRDSSSFSVILSANTLNNNWNFIVFTGKIDSNHMTTINSYFNSLTTDSGSPSSITYFQDRSSGTLYIGTKSTLSSGFTGFLYDLNIFNTENLQYNDYTTSSCPSPCTSCPSDHNCPSSCSLSQYYNGSSCTNCMGSCTKGCRYSDACGLCKTKQCYQCTSFSGSCSICITNAESDGSGGCQCTANSFWHSNTASCDFCDALCSVCKQTTYFECTTCAAGKQIVGIICLNDCPYGYGNSCSSVSTAVIDQLFDTDFQGFYGIFTTGTDPSSYQPFINPENIDPVPAYARGLYFDGNMYLLSSVSVYLSHSFAMGAWVYVATNGDLLEKQTRLIFASTGAITLAMESAVQVTSTQTLSPSSSFTDWAYVSFTIYYTSNASFLSLYINGVSRGSITISGRIYRDQASTNLQLGKSSNSGFVGFIYYFQLWNTQITGFSAIISGFTFCGSGSGVSCLGLCGISAYENLGSCLMCNSCSKGCVRASTCNICDDQLCSVCTGFGSGKCTNCVSNASKNPTNCACNAGYRTSNDGFSCVACPVGCQTCTGGGYYQCTSCISGYYFLSIQCLLECPSGYTQNSSTNNCDLTTATYSILFSNSILLDTISGITVGSSNTNTYPNYDTNDPYPSYLRGYYFNSNSNLKTNFMLAPSFSISVWINPTVSGLVMSKFVSATQWLIQVLASGQPNISLLLSDSSTIISVTGASSVLNGWFFVSFDCIINADGTTTVNSYIDGTNQVSSTTATSLYHLDSLSGILQIGDSILGFTGFLWIVKIYSQSSHSLDDWQTAGCSGSCTKCPADLSCPDNCPLSQYYNGSGCTNCIASCSKGCRNSDTCRLCKTKECATCTEFSGTNSCLTCITNAVTDGTGGCTCNTNAFWVSLSQTCEICDVLCSTCIKTTYFECSICSGSSQLVGSVCLNGCPYGFGPSCSEVATPIINQSFDIDFQGSYGIFTTGSASSSFQFFNSPESIDPIPSYKRGLYFDGSMYLLSNTNILLSHSFSIGAWLYVITDGDWLEKQNQYLALYSTGAIKATMEDFTQTTAIKTLSSGSNLNDWNYLSVTFEYSSGTTTITIYINGASITNSPILNYVFRDLTTTSLMIGKSSSSGFIGFINTFQLWNTPISDFSSSINAICSSSYTCLWPCDLSHYYDGTTCVACNSCNNGCIRASTCNICDDLLCSVCTGFGSGKCTQCVINASGASNPCVCNPGYTVSSDGFSCDPCYNGCSQCTGLTSHDCTACFTGFYFYSITGECLTACPSGYTINPGTNICVKCDSSCKTCISPSYLDCLTCNDGYYKVSGICVSSCPSGYSKSASGCILVQEQIFDLDLNTLNGVIYDKASSIPVVTGSTSQFYPDYETDDPIPAYLRGFWFNGHSSVLRLPEYSNYTSPKLVIAPIFTISIWLNTETSFSALLSKHNISDNYSALYYILLISSKPTISLLINSSPFFYMCQVSLNSYEWSHIAFTLETAQNGYNTLSCYINGILDSSGMTGYGAFLDIGSHTTITIGAQISSSAVYNFYQGFIYTIQMFNVIKSISSLSTTSCTESCSVCPISQICISNCKINQYWSGPSYNKCYNCNIKCEKTCRDWRPTCSLCSNLLCEVCTDYSTSGCSSCKVHAINPDSCICDLNYVLDASSNSSCIPLEAGGFRGPDGILYPCPNHCSNCESLTECSACVENASLKNNLCYCDLGYNGIKNCTLVSFSAKLSVLSDNSLYLTFSDTLAFGLNINDFTISVKKLGEISYKIEQINSTCYYISLTISEEISKGTLATLEFLNLTELRSVSNGVLNSSEISVYLNSYDPAPYSPAIAAVSSQATASAQAAISGALALSVINPNPSSLWSMMNSLQILSYLTLSGIPFSSKMSTFLNNLNSFNLFPNAFKYFIDKNEGKTPYSQAKDFGFDTDLILLTTGNDFTLIVASLLVFPIVFFFSRCSFRWLGKKFTKTVRAYQFAFYLRFWIQCYLELGAAASVGLITFGFNNITQATNFIICSAIYALLVITPPAYFWFSYKNKNRIQSREKTFTELFSSLFYEFRTDRGLLATQYYFLFFVRRFIYIINLVFLRDYPQTEVTINIVLSAMTIMHLIFFWPFEDSILQISNLLTEASIFLIMSATSVYLFNINQKIVSAIEDGIVAIVIAIMGIQTIASIAIFARTIYEIIKYKLTKAGIVKRGIHPLKNEIKKI